jgi:hypothetical protein
MADATANPQVKQVAQAVRASAMQNKNGGAKPATPAAPAQVEVKKP